MPDLQGKHAPAFYFFFTKVKKNKEPGARCGTPNKLIAKELSQVQYRSDLLENFTFMKVIKDIEDQIKNEIN